MTEFERLFAVLKESGCAKKQTACGTYVKGQWVYAVNSCEYQGDACPRLNLPSGTGYELCKAKHTEAMLAEALGSKKSDGTAWLVGHYWVCEPCAAALKAVGGFDLGFERAGIKTVWQVEIDEYCRRVLARHFPDAQRFSDIRECGAHNLPAVDILSGGFPCQDISNAGKRAGIDGERSGLWSEYARIIRELRPRYVVVENVAALLGRGMERVLGDLAACGYDAEWQSIRASDVGAPHIRERIWIIAYSQSDLRGTSWNDRPISPYRSGTARGLRERLKDGVSI